MTTDAATTVAAARGPLDLGQDPIELTRALVDVPSVSQREEELAALVHAALVAVAERSPQVEVLRHGNRVLARTNRGLGSRVILAGHLDTVPIANNVPSRRGLGVGGEDSLHGCGTVDMKSGDAVFLHLFAELADAPELRHDLTVIFYDCEEISAQHNGLGHIERELPEWLRGDVAILGEPTGAVIEAGCQGTLRIVVRSTGVRAHSARSWLGSNAIHRLAEPLAILAAYRPRQVEIDGCGYREGLQAVNIVGGVAGNVVPDVAELTVNFRFAPDRNVEQAVAHVAQVLGLAAAGRREPESFLAVAEPQADEPDVTWAVTDSSPGALPGLGHPAAAALVAAAGGVRAKYGWTDVSRFSALGIPAVNFGPGDPGFAHKRDEQCPVEQITTVTAVLRRYLAGP